MAANSPPADAVEDLIEANRSFAAQLEACQRHGIRLTDLGAMLRAGMFVRSETQEHGLRYVLLEGVTLEHALTVGRYAAAFDKR